MIMTLESLNRKKEHNKDVKKEKKHDHQRDRQEKDRRDPDRNRSHKDKHSASRKHDDRERSHRKSNDHKISRNEERKVNKADDDVSSSHKKREKHDNKKREKKRKSSRSRSTDRSIDSRDRKRSKSEKQSKRGKSSKHRKDEKRKDPIVPSIAVDKSKLFPLGDVLGRVPKTLLDENDDYFAYHQHFWVYLFREKQVAFNDLSSEQARDTFKEFVNDYNTGKLESAYYLETGLPSEACDEIKTTQHKWGINISDREGKHLQMLQQGIRKQTEYSNKPVIDSEAKDKIDRAFEKMSASRDIDRKDHSSNDRRANQRLREHVCTVEEELIGGRKDGRERQLEKKKEIGARIHGAARDREEAPDLPDDAIYGTGESSDFKKSLAYQKQRDRQNEEKKLVRITELKAKEDHKKTEMLKMLGLSDRIKAGEKIQIRPRSDDG